MSGHDIGRQATPVSSRRWTWIVPTLLAGAALLAFEPALRRGWFDLKSALLISTLLVVLQFHRILRFLDTRALGRLGVYFAGSTLLVFATVVLGVRLSIYSVAVPVSRLMLAWAFVLTLVPPAVDGPSIRLRPRVHLGVLLAAAMVLWLVCVQVSGGIKPYIIDEVLYLLQAAHVWHPPFMQPLDAHLAPFFSLQQTYFRGDYLAGQYTPGWPAVLSWFPGAIGHWLLLAGSHLAMIVVTYEFGRRVASRRAGVLAAALVAVNGMEISYSMSFFSEAFTTVLLMTAGIAFISGFRTANLRRQIGLWVACGFLAGWAGATRPLTGLVLWVALVIVGLVIERPSRNTVVRASAAMVVGALLPIGYLFWYNQRTTGSPLHFGYALANHGYQALGFGMRGFVRYGSSGSPVLDVSAFGTHEATVHFAHSLRQMLMIFWPASLILPLLFLARHLDVRVRWRLVAPFALLPAAYFFYFYSDIRFFFELLPLVMIGTAWLVVGILDKRPRAAIALSVLMFVSIIGAIGPRVLWRRSLDRTYAPAFQAIQHQRAQHPHVLVFVRDDEVDPSKPFFSAMYAYNIQGGFHGPVVVARDLGDANATLLAHYPGYVPFLLVNRGKEHPGVEFIPLPDSVARGARTLLGCSRCAVSTR